MKRLSDSLLNDMIKSSVDREEGNLYYLFIWQFVSVEAINNFLVDYRPENSAEHTVEREGGDILTDMDIHQTLLLRGRTDDTFHCLTKHLRQQLVKTEDNSCLMYVRATTGILSENKVTTYISHIRDDPFHIGTYDDDEINSHLLNIIFVIFQYIRERFCLVLNCVVYSMHIADHCIFQGSLMLVTGSSNDLLHRSFL